MRYTWLCYTLGNGTQWSLILWEMAPIKSPWITHALGFRRWSGANAITFLVSNIKSHWITHALGFRRWSGANDITFLLSIIKSPWITHALVAKAITFLVSIISVRSSEMKCRLTTNCLIVVINLYMSYSYYILAVGCEHTGCKFCMGGTWNWVDSQCLCCVNIL